MWEKGSTKDQIPKVNSNQIRLILDYSISKVASPVVGHAAAPFTEVPSSSFFSRSSILAWILDPMQIYSQHVMLSTRPIMMAPCREHFK